MRFAFGLIIGLLFVLVGCAPSEPNLAPGTYITDLAIEELPERFGPPWNPEGYLGRMIAGEWEITFSDEGEVIWRQNGSVWSSGDYNVNLAALEFGFGSACSSIGIMSGTYNWSLDGDIVTFERIEDDCEGRAIGLTLKPWTRK